MNLAKFDQNSKFMIYGWRNSKPIVQMDSYHQHASFSCAAYFDLKHCCIDFNGSRWSIYLKERVSITSPTWLASPPPRKRPIYLNERSIIYTCGFRQHCRLNTWTPFSQRTPISSPAEDLENLPDNNSLKLKTQNLQFMAYETWNQLSEWIHITDPYIFIYRLFDSAHGYIDYKSRWDFENTLP
jgi:hypothetical protein